MAREIAKNIHYRETIYGFEYGAAKVTRLFSDEKKQTVTIQIETPKEIVQVYVTKTGKVRIFSKGEWQKPQKKGGK